MAAPKGNLFAIGNNGGRPPEYKTPDELWDRCVEYFETVQQKNGKYKPGIEGLVFYLGFAHRKSLGDYERRSDEFCYTINRAKTFIKMAYEGQLHGFAWAGAAFALKNIGASDWKDEVTQNQNQVVTKVTIEEKTRDDK